MGRSVTRIIACVLVALIGAGVCPSCSAGPSDSKDASGVSYDATSRYESLLSCLIDTSSEEAAYESLDSISADTHQTAAVILDAELIRYSYDNSEGGGSNYSSGHPMAP